MPGPQQNFTIDPTRTGNTTSWEVCHLNASKCGDGSAARPYPKVKLSANKGKYKFEFKIVGDETNQEIKFAATNPITLKDGPQDQIELPSGGGTTTLNFTGKNDKPNNNEPDPVLLDYELNFEGNAPITKLDPIIINGGSISKSASSFVPEPGSPDSFYLISYVFVAALLATIVGMMVMRRR